MKRALSTFGIAILALASVDCGSVRRCKAGTVLVRASFEGMSASADEVAVEMTFNGSTLRAQGSHTPGQSEGTIELDFAGAYPAGQSITLTFVASQSGNMIGAGSVGPITLPAGCASLDVNISSTAEAGDMIAAGGDLPDGACGETGCPVCGDGNIETAKGEQCDNLGGADTATCNGSGAGAVACKSSACGDGYTNAAAGEQCDNGASDTAGCNGNSAGAVSAGVACQKARCGDSYVNAAASSPAGGEQCDEGAANSDSGTCLVGCYIPKCGDGFVEPSKNEVCDDHNLNACGLCKNAFGCTASLNAMVKTPSAAVGSITSGTNNIYNDGETFTLSDGAHTVTFEFDKDGSLGAGHAAIDAVNSATAAVMACKICQAINGSGLSITTSGNGCPAASCTGTSFQFTNNALSGLGNVAITSTVSSSGFGFAGMNNGATSDCPSAIGCTNAKDCASGFCTLNQTCPGGVACGTCAAPTCSDGKKNGSETDVDCGGSCPGCNTGKTCIFATDCVSGVCSSTVYVTLGTAQCQ